MSRRVALYGEAKGLSARSRSESESEMGVESYGADAKPCDLPRGRVKGG